MSELSIESLSKADKERALNVSSFSTLAAAPRTREQCQLGMLRFAPDCNYWAVCNLLHAHGYTTERTRDGDVWIMPPKGDAA